MEVERVVTGRHASSTEAERLACLWSRYWPQLLCHRALPAVQGVAGLAIAGLAHCVTWPRVCKLPAQEQGAGDSKGGRSQG